MCFAPDSGIRDYRERVGDGQHMLLSVVGEEEHPIVCCRRARAAVMAVRSER